MTRRIAVVDHGMGNLRSVAQALTAAGGEVTVATDPGPIENADGLCVPGQGIFGRCMESLAATGFDDVIRAWIADDKPYLGICLGMQVLFSASDERGPITGLDLIGGRVTRLPERVPVPHIGWNTVNGEYFYFDHSFAVNPADEGIVSGWCEHGDRFAAAIRTGSITGVQFHPEKSSTAGIALLRDWVTAL